MASQVSVAIERDAAITRINTMLKDLAEEKGQDYAPLPTQGREQAIVVRNQLVHIANALEALLNKPVDADRDTENAKTEDVDSARKIDKPTAPKNTKEKR